MAQDKNDPKTNRDHDFESAWFSQYSAKNVVDNFAEIKKYAFQAFDKLDTNQNGFIERAELELALQSDSTTEREKSFISFLLNNQEAIATSYDEEWAENDGISRNDIQAYFALIEGLV